MKKKIIIIGSAYPLRGGLTAYNERLAREFLKNGFDVTIYTFSLQYPAFLFPGKTQYSSDPAPTNLDIKVCINSINPLNWISVGRKIKNEKPDVAVIRFWLPFMAPCLGTIARIIRKNRHTKIISILDNVIPHEKRPGDKPFIKYFVKAVDGFIAMSQQVMNDLMLFTKTENRLLIPHPIYDNFGEKVSKEEARNHLHLSSNEKYILFFGFIRKYKGLDLLLEAMADERIRKENIKLIVAGEFYEDRKPYDEIIEKNNLTDRLILKTDFIPDDEVKYYFCASDLIVQPYRNATQSGISQIAYHFEKPMVVTNVGGLSEIIPHGKAGYVVNSQPKDIADAIISFYNSGKEKEFIEGVIDEKKKFSWKNIMDGILALSS